jgi:hypothetical protein
MSRRFMSRDFPKTSTPPVPEPERSRICVATSAYTAKERDEVSFEAGDLIRLSYRDDSLMIGKKIFGDKKSGCFYPESVRMIHPSTDELKTYCKTLCDYEAKCETELSFGKHEYIIILSTIGGEEGWMKGKLLSNGKVGVFPMNYVRFLSDLEAELELMLKEEEEQRLFGNKSGEETDIENMKPGSNLKDPEIVLKNDNRQEASSEMVKEKDVKAAACLSSSNLISTYSNTTCDHDDDRDNVKEDASTEFPRLSSKDNSVFPAISEAEVKFDGLGITDGNGMGDKTATPQACADKNMVPRMQQQASGDEFIVPQGAHPSKLSKKDRTANQIVKEHGVLQKQKLVQNVPSHIIFPVVNDPTILDYKFHIEKDENSTRPGCTSYTATVKWTVKSRR